MKIAIPSTGKSFESRISLDFGRAPFFLIIDQDSMEVMPVENPHTESQPCAGILVAEILAEEGVKLVIADLCGERAARALQQAEIKLITGASGKIRDVFEKYKRGLLLDRIETISCDDCELINLVTKEVIRLLRGEYTPNIVTEKVDNPGKETTNSEGELTVKSNTEIEATGDKPVHFPSNSIKKEDHQPIIAVASGKGGTGKTLVATSLALASGENIQFLDCDVEEPNAYVFLKPQLQETIPVMLPFPQINLEKCTGCGDCAAFCEYNALAVVKGKAIVFSELCHSCGGCSLVCPEGAISETQRQIGVVEIGKTDGMPVVDGVLNVGEAIAPPIIKAVKAQAKPDMITIIDSPPGTACPMIESVKDSDYCVLVTEPTPFGYHDLTLAVGVARELGVPCGVIINRANIGDDKVQQYCESENIEILMQIPMDRKIAESYSDGIPLIEALPEYKEKFANLLRRILEKKGNRRSEK
jgi:MinD superfamily P-loop ATPase/predicted Fe-Mo cluster-binding NifX family protein